MMVKYFVPGKDFSWEELDQLTAKKKGKWTWPMQGLLNFQKMGFEIANYEEFDYQAFIKRGGDYLVEKYGKEAAEEQIKMSDISKEQRIAKEFIKVFGTKFVLPTLKTIRDFLRKGYIAIVNVNYYPLYRQPGYSGHFVIVLSIDKRSVRLHDPGLPRKDNMRIPLRQFLAAWEYPDGRSRNLTAFKLKKT